MNVNNDNMNLKWVDGGVTAAKGFKASGIHCGIRKNKDKKDLALVFSEKSATVAAVYTQNLVKGAPCVVTKNNISDGFAQAIICNSGIANTCAFDGIEKAELMAKLTAKALGISANDVVVASTGVIGPSINIAPIESGLAELVKNLSENGGTNCALAIMTTDTVPKQRAVQFDIDGVICAVGGMAKGSGMIAPNMATMLGFITTDVAISSQMLSKALSAVVADTFNMLSIDGDTSTNDMLTCLANGCSSNMAITDEGDNYDKFYDALFTICSALVMDLAADGEGATKLLQCEVSSASTKNDARTIAKSVINSSLVKTAMFGADANWGRVLCAVGYSGAAVDVTKVDIAFLSRFGKVSVCAKGAEVDFDEELAKKILKAEKIIIDIRLGDGDEYAVAWGCDLTYDYVKINGDYRT